MKLCAPAFIYVIFSLTQVIIDTYMQQYNKAIVKMGVMIVFTLLLNALCKSGMSVISWIIVMVPFIFMSVVVAAILYSLGDPSAMNEYGGNLIYSTETDKDK